MKLKFSGTRALITGGTSNLAISLAKYLIDAGLFPILTYRNDKGLSFINKKLKSYDGSYQAAYLNLADYESIYALFNEIDDDLDFLIDFAHTDFESFVASASKDNIYRYFEENVSFCGELIKTAAKAMLKKKRGRLVFISSSAAGKSNPGQGFYAASKLASEALYRNLGLELGNRGITTVTLRPAYIDAGRGKKYIESHEDEVKKSMPIGRPLNLNEVAETIMFYISDSASGFNAAEITLDGGQAAKK